MHATLTERGRTRDLALIADLLPLPGQVAYIRQQHPNGLGHAVWCARHLVAGEPVAVLLADDMVMAAKPCLQQMVEEYARVGGNLVAVMDVPREQTNRYGVLATGKRGGPAGRGPRPGREAEAGGGAVDPLGHRPLHPAARGLRR